MAAFPVALEQQLHAARDGHPGHEAIAGMLAGLLAGAARVDGHEPAGSGRWPSWVELELWRTARTGTASLMHCADPLRARALCTDLRAPARADDDALVVAALECVSDGLWPWLWSRQAADREQVDALSAAIQRALTGLPAQTPITGEQLLLESIAWLSGTVPFEQDWVDLLFRYAARSAPTAVDRRDLAAAASAAIALRGIPDRDRVVWRDLASALVLERHDRLEDGPSTTSRDLALLTIAVLADR